MNKLSILLFLGMALIVVWLILCLTNPLAGYVMSLTCFIAIAAIIIFMLTCYALARHRSNR